MTLVAEYMLKQSKFAQGRGLEPSSLELRRHQCGPQHGSPARPFVFLLRQAPYSARRHSSPLSIVSTSLRIGWYLLHYSRDLILEYVATCQTINSYKNYGNAANFLLVLLNY